MNPPPYSVDIQLNISAQDYLYYYQQQGINVVARALDGRKIQFPARILQPFVQHHGVSGVFRIVFNADGKFQAIHRL